MSLLLAAALLAAEPAAGAPYLSLTRPFAAVADATAGQPDDARFARFQAEIAPLAPDFYRPRDGEPAARYRARVLDALRAFPAIRARYEAVEAGFPDAFARGLAHFRATFPDFRDPAGVLFLHSLGELDGGTRQLGRRSVLVFGADGIARYHDPADIGPFLDHELFHVLHGRTFADCDPVWCGLWQEGLATYAAKAMNPGADDAALLLVQPKPIRAATDARWREALCLLEAKRLSTTRADYGLFFFGNPNGTALPSRFGYYLGLRLVERAAQGSSLQALTRLDQRQAERLVVTTLAAMIGEAGGCGAPR